MSIRDFIKDLKTKRNTELGNLYKKPVVESIDETPEIQVFEKNVYQQADLLYLPEDDGYKYLLVCVDLYDRSVDAVPLKQRNNKTVLEAFDKIYKRNNLDYPLFITFDQGTEFKDDTVKYFKKNGTNVRYGLTGRSRTLAMVERMNQTIGTILLKRMASQELLTGEVSKEWVEDLPELIEVLNENKKTPLKKAISPEPIITEYTGKLLQIGQKVRLLLDYPVNNVDNKREIGKFRSGDARWTIKTYKISQVLLKPGYPPMYLVDGDNETARTKNQLQVIKGNEKEPELKYNRGKGDYFIIAKILDKKTENRKQYYQVRWKGHTLEQATWIPVGELNRTKDLKDMKDEFNANNP